MANPLATRPTPVDSASPRPAAPRSRAARLALLVAVGIAACAPAAPPPPEEAPRPPVSAAIADAAPLPNDASADASADAAPAPFAFANPVVVKSAKAMVVTDDSHATKVGREMLAAGGNAADAAVALAFAMAVTFPTAGNIGGGGFAVSRFGGKATALDFREVAPKSSKRDMYLDKDGKPSKDASDGIKSVGVPGAVAGLHELWKTHGSKKKTWKEVLAPAIALAKEGFAVDQAFLSALSQGGERLKRHPVSAALYFPGGNPPALGSTFKNPDLAATLERIAQNGPKGFYEGETAKAIATQMKAEGGYVGADDLKAYKAKWRTPLELTYRGHKIVSMPPPSSGGVTLAMILHVLEGYDLRALGFQTPESLHYVFEAMRRAYAARNAKLGDPDFVKLPLDTLLSDGWAKEQRAGILPDKATPSSAIATGPASGGGPHTTHFSVVDTEGNAVSLTTTVNYWFGSGVTVKGGGFLLNNEMDDFASVPGTANGFGLVQGEANAIAPGKRMLSSMSPTLVTDKGGALELVLGGAGGPTIITAVLQELLAVVDFGKDPATAAAAPRFHMQHLPDVVMHEASGIDPAVKARLEAMGYTFKERGHIADAPLLGKVGAEWFGIAEPRRVGGLAEGL